MLRFAILCSDPSNVSSALLRTKVSDFKCFFCWAVRFSPGQGILEKTLCAGRQKWMWNEYVFSHSHLTSPLYQRTLLKRNLRWNVCRCHGHCQFHLKPIVGSLGVGYSPAGAFGFEKVWWPVWAQPAETSAYGEYWYWEFCGLWKLLQPSCCSKPVWLSSVEHKRSLAECSCCCFSL